MQTFFQNRLCHIRPRTVSRPEKKSHTSLIPDNHQQYGTAEVGQSTVYTDQLIIDTFLLIKDNLVHLKKGECRKGLFFLGERYRLTFVNINQIILIDKKVSQLHPSVHHFRDIHFFFSAFLKVTHDYTSIYFFLKILPIFEILCSKGLVFSAISLTCSHACAAFLSLLKCVCSISSSKSSSFCLLRLHKYFPTIS